jgi:hypothetical protein
MWVGILLRRSRGSLPLGAGDCSASTGAACAGLRPTSCYRDDGPSDHGEHPLGLALDAVPSDGDWSRTLAAAQAFGWLASCGSTGCADRLRPPMRFIGYNGYPGHGDPAHGGANAHIHFSWIHAAAAPYTPAAWVEVFSTTDQVASIP